MNMNSVSQDVNNYLVITKTNDYFQELYKLCLKKVKVGLLVLILTSTTFDFSELLEELNITRAELKRFIVINYTKINDISNKLMDLHDWTLLPSLVVVDVSNIITIELSTVSSVCTQFMQRIALCAASFMSYLHTVSSQKTKQVNHAKDLISRIDGLFIVKADEEKFGDKHLKLLKDLYFYKNVAVEDLKLLSGLLNNNVE